MALRIGDQLIENPELVYQYDDMLDLSHGFLFLIRAF